MDAPAGVVAQGFAREGTRAPAPDQKGPDAAQLASQGALLDAKSESALWNGLGSFSGFAAFFPKLPSAELGAEAEWIAHWQSTGSPEVRERLGKTSEERIRVRLDSWITVGTETAAILTARSTSDVGDLFAALTPPGTPGKAASTKGRSAMRAQYVVLASGRVLHARVERSTEVVLMLDGRASSFQHHRTSLELRLVKACDGPTLPVFERPVSVEGLALATIKTLRDAAIKKDQAAVVGTLSPSLVARHGKDKIAALLVAHVERYGAMSLGSPEVPFDFKADAGETELRLSGSAAQLEGSEGPYSVTLWFRGRQSGDRFEISSIRSAKSSNSPSILEVSDQKLHSQAATDPKAK